MLAATAMTEFSYDLVVIGAGPGGYVAAIRAAQLGLKVACVEKESELGGTCLRIGCIPSKALLEASEKYKEVAELKRFGIKVQGLELDLPAILRHKERTVKALTQGVASLFRKHQITHHPGHGRLDGPGRVVVAGASPAVLNARNILIATGSEVAWLPGIERDQPPAGEVPRIGSSTEALSYPQVPAHLVVIGAGAIGLELGSVWRRLGARVTVLEYLDRILPGMDAETAQLAHKLFKRQGFEFHLGVRVTGARAVGAECVVEAEGREPITCDRVLVAVGRRPATADLGLASVSLSLDAKGRIPVDAHFATQAPGVFAIGDAIAGPMLAHKAEEEGVACVEHLVTGYGHVNYDAIPSVVYTQPEIAAVGKSEEDLQAAGVAYKKGVFPFIANGRARALAATDGQVKVLAHAQTDRVLGVHIVGPRAGDLIAEAAVAIEFGASSEDLAVHAHPTLAEALKEAALAVANRTLNL
jgi:dihydrolipoamide dehydrogenase